MAIWREDVETALDRIGGVGSLSNIYDSIKAIRRGNLPHSWQAIVRRELEYNSSDSESWQEKYDLFYSLEGIGKGIWGLRSIEHKTEEAADLNSNEPAGRQKATTYRILRDTKLARQLKALHNNQCQLCGYSIPIPPDKAYSEAHHIKPLGEPHNGPDIKENIIVLCPNHHAQLDLGSISLDLDSLRNHQDQSIDKKYIDYHNEEILKC